MRRLLLITTLLILNACQTNQLPPAPKGDTCIVDVTAAGADCAPISPSVEQLKYDANAQAESAAFIAMIRSLAEPNGFVKFSDMDNYVCFSPDTWGNIQTWIGELRVQAQKQCQ